MRLRDPFTVQRVSGVLLMLAMIPHFFLWQFTGSLIQSYLLMMSILILLITSFYLFAKKDTGNGPTLIHLGLACALISLL
jgi:hypothetical protein